MKAHYPVEFMAALLSLEDDPAKIPVKIEVCKSMGIKILPPNINRSEKEFSVPVSYTHLTLPTIYSV